jgi:head-tail adaptor
MRYLDGVNCTQQVIFDNRKFQIESVLPPDSRRRTLVLTVVEINDSAQQ